MSDFLAWFQAPTPRWVVVGVAVLIWLLLNEIDARLGSALSFAGRHIEELREQVAELNEALEGLKEQVAELNESGGIYHREGVSARIDDIEARLRELEDDDDDGDDDYP